ncbi:cell death activator CIDE-B, partial [Pimephales promelas]
MEYAKTLLPSSLMRPVSSMACLAQRMLPPPQARPYRVCSQNRRRRTGFTSTSLGDLRQQVASSFVMACQMLTLVLEDDGTVVDSEAFFQSLPNNTPFMVLEKGEVWTSSKRVQQWHILIILMNKICYWLTVSPLTKSVIF